MENNSIKKIGWDVSVALNYPRGMGNYTIQILKMIEQIDKTNEYILYSYIPDNNNILPQNNNFKFKLLKAKGLVHYEQLVLPKACKQDNISILHCPANTAPIFLNNKIKKVITLHDIIFLKSFKIIPMPKNKLQLLGRIYRSIVVKSIIKQCSFVFTDSCFSQDDITKNLQVPLNKIDITYIGTENLKEDSSISKNEIEKKLDIKNKDYIFHLGGDAPSKNTITLLEIFSESDNVFKDLYLVVAGIKDLQKSHLYNNFKNNKNIIFLPYISEKELIALYKYSKMFIFPSLYEGFGIPVLEAMKYKTPVIATDRTSVPEIVADAGILVNPVDKDAIKNAIFSLLNNESLRQNLISLGEQRLNNFSWLNSANIILEKYKEL